MTFATDQLPTPSALEYEDGESFYVSGKWSDGAPFVIRSPDRAANPLRWSLVYTKKPAAVIATLRAHYKYYHARSFDWTPPGGSTVLRVIYSEAPVIRWNNPTNGEARLAVEEALAH